MSTTVDQDTIRVIIPKDHMTAELLIPADFPRDTLTEQTCLNLLQQSGVEITEQVTEAVKQMLATPPETGQEQQQVLATATPAQHGDHGYVQWLVSEPDQTKEPQTGQDGQKEKQKEDADNGEEVSHYDRSAYIVVKPGDVVGRVIEPTAGADGRDVLGKTIAAIPGRPIFIKNDETILRDGADQLIAQADGVLNRTPDSVAVCQLIEVPDYVDFSTGNIDFTGSVVVRKGVRDCFVVKATGSVEVRGLIEAATIECGGSLTAQGGMAGRERGFAKVGGNLTAKYLDNIQAEVRGDMEIWREVINCDLLIHGEIKSPQGTVIGGKTVITGPAEVAALGSGAFVATEIILGTVPHLEPIAQQLERLIEQLATKREKIEYEQKLMGKKKPSMMTNTDKERQTELMFEHQTASTKHNEGQAAHAAVIERIQQLRTVNLKINNKLFTGVTITVGKQSFVMNKDLKGPVRILVENREVVYCRDGALPTPLTTVAELKAAPAK